MSDKFDELTITLENEKVDESIVRLPISFTNCLMF